MIMAGFACRQRKRLLRWVLPATAILALLAINPARAQIGSARYSSIVIDAASGNVLEEVNADEPRHPASLTKMMTLYMTFEALRDRRLALDQDVPVSAHAASMEPSKLGLMPTSRITVEQAILGLVTKSANDAAAALGELLGGSEDRFAQMMTLRARALGMSHSVFQNASGLPDPDQWSTARDLAILGRRLIADFPVYYRYFSTPSFVWHRLVIFNHDNMLRSYPGADGLKTGYTEASGHNLVTSAVRGGVRLIGVVLGAQTNGERDIHMASLLDHGFEQMDVPIEHRPAPAPNRMMLIASARAVEVSRPAPQSRPHVMPVATTGRSIQVGSYNSANAARAAAATARKAADSGEIRVEPATVAHKTIWRAQVVGLHATEAHETCASMMHHGEPCMILHPETRAVASR